MLLTFLNSKTTKLKNANRLILFKSGLLRNITGAFMWVIGQQSGKLIVLIGVPIYCLIPMIYLCFIKCFKKKDKITKVKIIDIENNTTT